MPINICRYLTILHFHPRLERYANERTTSSSPRRLRKQKATCSIRWSSLLKRFEERDTRHLRAKDTAVRETRLSSQHCSASHGRCDANASRTRDFRKPPTNPPKKDPPLTTNQPFFVTCCEYAASISWGVKKKPDNFRNGVCSCALFVRLRQITADAKKKRKPPACLLTCISPCEFVLRKQTFSKDFYVHYFTFFVVLGGSLPPRVPI